MAFTIREESIEILDKHLLNALDSSDFKLAEYHKLIINAIRLS